MAAPRLPLPPVARTITLPEWVVVLGAWLALDLASAGPLHTELAGRGVGLDAVRRAVEQLGGTLVTVAKDVKIQVEFNPAAALPAPGSVTRPRPGPDRGPEEVPVPAPVGADHVDQGASSWTTVFLSRNWAARPTARR